MVDAEKLRDLLRVVRGMKDALRYLEETIFDQLHPHEISDTIEGWEANFSGDRILDLSRDPDSISVLNTKVTHD